MVVRWGVALLVTVGGAVHAQSLQSRVETVGSGHVNLHFEGREGICGDGSRFMRLGTSYQGSYSDATRSAACVTGPVQVRLTMEEGRVTHVETWVGTLRTREGHDLGGVSAREAAQYFLSLAGRISGSTGGTAILPAVLAESSVVWPALLKIARDETLSRNVRRESAFWLSRYAAGAIDGRKNDPLTIDDGDDEGISLKKHAVFVLSQLPHGEGVSELIHVAESGADHRVRSQALFWLGQTDDGRALAVFESILRGS